MTFSFAPRRLLVALAVLLVLGAGIFWLRGPTLGVPLWNIDEGNLAVAAGELRHGAVMYRDMVDHRGPLSYYAAATLFRFTGTSVFALHLATTALIVLTAGVLFVLGRRLGGLLAGAGAAVIYGGLACYLLTPSDAYAAHTEWLLVVFTTLAAFVLRFDAAPPSFSRSAGAGALLGLAFLTKQPALLDLGAPLGAAVWLVVVRHWPLRPVLRTTAGLLTGFAVVVGCTVLWFVAHGAWADLAFYTWTYNTRYYGPETTWNDRLLAPVPFFTHLFLTYPFVAVAVALGFAALTVRVIQFQPTDQLSRARPGESYLVLWSLTSLGAAMSSGRSFDHYFIQCLPPFALAAAWVINQLPLLGARLASSFGRFAGIAVATVVLLGVVWTARAAREVAPPPRDPALPLADYIRTHSRPADRVFVWGYNADIHLYAGRRPATRYIFCTFQTGLIPWTNLDPARDTTYAIVPGSMDALLADLARVRPLFIVDCGVGPHRRFNKYPLDRFAPLRAVVDRDYLEVEPTRWLGHGFRLFIRRDAPRPAPGDLVASTADAPFVRRSASNTLTFGADAPAGQSTLVRLALMIDDREIAAATTPPSTGLVLTTKVDLPAETPGLHHAVTVATWADGHRTVSSPLEIKRESDAITPAQSTAFALPRIRGTVSATGVRALFNPNAGWTDGVHQFSLHAPSLVRYILPADATAVRGHFGLPAGAYAPENKAPSDGAQFLIRLVTPDGRIRTLLDRLLRPAREPGDRPEQSFRVDLSGAPEGSVLELEISPGPDGNPSSDWTYWSDVELETSS